MNQSHQTVHSFSDRANCQFVCFTVYSEPVAPNRTLFLRSGQWSVRLFYRLQLTSRTKPYTLSPIGPMVSSFVLPFTMNQSHQTVHSFADRSNGQFVCFTVYSEPVAPNRTLFRRSVQLSVRLFIYLPFTVNQSHQTVHSFSDRANGQFVCFTVYSDPVAPNRTQKQYGAVVTIREGVFCQ